MSMIWLDMDGTIANLYKGAWLEDIINEDVRPYAIADRLVEEAKLMELIEQGYSLGIISWTAKNGSKDYNKAVRKTKVEWLKTNYPNVKFEHIHIVKYGTKKAYFKMSETDILIDDEKPNRENWNGEAVDPNRFFG